MPVKYSENYRAIKSRIRRLPKLVENMLISQTKKDAEGVRADFQEGIRKNNFRLEKLKPETIKRKRSQGMGKPATPLFGLGDGSDRSLINALDLKKGKKGWILKASKRLHHSRKIKLDYLLAIHEGGATFVHPNGALIRIPPRPVLMKAYQRYLRRKKKGEPAKEVKKAMLDYIRKGRIKK